MDKLFIKKFKNTFIAIALLCIASLLMILATIIILFANTKLNSQIRIEEKKLKGYKDIYQLVTDRTIKERESIKADLKKKYIDFIALFSSKGSASAAPVTSLIFKQYLFDLQDRLKEKAGRKKIPLPESLGFKKYELNVPDVSQAQVLIRELSMAEEIISLLLDSQIIRLVAVEFSAEPGNLKSEAKLNREILFKSFTIDLTVEADFVSLKEFLTDLSQKESVYIVKNVTIKKKIPDTGNLLIDIKIDYIEI